MSDSNDIYQKRRAELLRRIGQGVMLVPSQPLALRNGDVEHPYRQSSDLLYLTGFEEPESVLILTGAHAEHRSVLFLRPRDEKRERWDGTRLGAVDAPAALGIDAAFPIDELASKLVEYLVGSKRLHIALGRNEAFDRVVFASLARARARARRGVLAPTELIEPSVTLHEMRLVKDSSELELMRKAASISIAAHKEAMGVARPGAYEYEVESALLGGFRSKGSPRPAYESIVGSGPNATVLHYRDNDRQMQDGDLLLIDAGCEYRSYASDITRTFPVNGRFSEPQRRVYQLVLDAQYAAFAAVKPGKTLDDVHNAALRVLCAGMVELGWIEGPLEEALKEKRYEPYYMHRTSHWLGLDVHDVGAYYGDDGKARKLEPGFVLTVEPGIYVAIDAQVDPQFRGIGVRIEDDVLVTHADPEVLTADLATEIDDIERLLAAR